MREAPVYPSTQELLDTKSEKIHAGTIERRGSRLTIRFREDSKVDPAGLMAFVNDTPGASFSPTGELTWIGVPEDGPTLLAAVRGVVQRIAG